MLARALSPAAALYGGLTAARMTRRGQAAGVPVFCVGNLVVGGAGKTPAAIALARLLQAAGRSPAFLSRGYGRARPLRDHDAHIVDPDRDEARFCGDEPLLLARIAPTVVATDRVRAATAAVQAGADCLILDDGLQNPALRKDWTLAVADGVTGIGNGLCVPAGPLRAPADRQWASVSLLAVIGPGDAGERLAQQAEASGVAVTAARIEPDAATLARWRDRRLFAFAGIGRPAKFFDTLAAAGLDVVGTRGFPDHHPFSAADRHALSLAAAAAGALLVTTEKDRVRLPADTAAEALPVRLVFAEPALIRAGIGLSR